ncbi:MAG TPA: hypothetical protein VKR58_03425 [Aquella sp.]|nr:hypothetical protein [Aquella sp.]
MFKNKYNGFTALELMGGLVVIIFLIMAINRIADNIYKVRESNQLADQGKNFSQIADKYIEDNYRNLVTQTELGNDVVIPYPAIASYTPDNLSVITKNRQVPCIYIASDDNSRLMSLIRAFLIFGDTKPSNRTFSELDAASIARNIGGNAGILVRNGDAYTFKGGIENDLNLSAATLSNIASGCGFILPLPQNSLIIDLSKSKSLFASIKSNIDQQSTQNDPDPSLKKLQLTNMQTNIYLDNLYKESVPTTGNPAQHIYKALDYGKSTSSFDRIQIKAAAPVGAAISNSELAVSHAGLQSGLITPLSHAITAGSSCNADELGKILQDMSSITINSQVQCVYNPTFCHDPGYCYLPIKSTTFDYQFAIFKVSYMCPAGTVVDGNQPVQGISSKVSCPNIPDWTLTQSVHGEEIACYIGVTGMNFCQGYQAVCTYLQGKQTVAALAGLRCTSSTSTYTVDNYTQPY